jgi:hypothetical protein
MLASPSQLDQSLHAALVVRVVFNPQQHTQSKQQLAVMFD